MPRGAGEAAALVADLEGEIFRAVGHDDLDMRRTLALGRGPRGVLEELAQGVPHVLGHVGDLHVLVAQDFEVKVDAVGPFRQGFYTVWTISRISLERKK